MIFNDSAALAASGFSPQVCIVGSGPAGLALALRLERHKVPCLVVEAGGLEYSAQAQDAYAGSVVGDEYFDLSIARLRQFGGSSGHWAGWCRHLDDIDFEARPGVADSGWPIGRRDLDSFARDTESMLEIAPVPDDVSIDKHVRQVFYRFSPPVRFGSKYREHLERSPTIGLLVNSPLVDIVPARDRIDHIKVWASGQERTVKAPVVVLAAGGIENSRLLLWANARHRGGVVPNAASLGRYWMEHPENVVGEALLLSFTDMRIETGMRFYAPTAQYLRERGTGSFGMRLMAGENLAKALVRDGVCHAPRFFREWAQKVHGGLACGAIMMLSWEQLPHPNNRIELDEKNRDATGVPRVKLHWRRTERDRETAKDAMELVGSFLANADLGRAKFAKWLLAPSGFPKDEGAMAGFHHMGGTRMASRPDAGVVDAHCRVHGVDNLYVAGSSVFPTGGFANPTYTIVQLALRLGDHLASKVPRMA